MSNLITEGCPIFDISTRIAPVCGDDGNTYDNVSILKDAHCKSIKDIKVAFKGHCDEHYDLIEPGKIYFK
jgi:hypothetical protein